jgi:hypothetical protein
LIGDLGDAIEHDPEVRQARSIADAARKRLVACMSGAQEAIDPAEAQHMLDAFRSAVVHAEDAEDRVLLHRGLLTSVEAARRAARRRPVSAGADEPARPGRGGGGRRGTGRVRGAVRVQRGGLARVAGWAAAFVAAGAVGVALARWLGVRPPLARW